MKEKYKSNPLNFGISKSESTSSFQAVSEKEKATNKEKELEELSELKSVVEKPDSSLVPQVKCDSNFIDNELSNRDVEIPLNPEISNIYKRNITIINIGSTENFAEGKIEKSITVS